MPGTSLALHDNPSYIDVEFQEVVKVTKRSKPRILIDAELPVSSVFDAEDAEFLAPNPTFDKTTSTLRARASADRAQSTAAKARRHSKKSPSSSTYASTESRRTSRTSARRSGPRGATSSPKVRSTTESSESGVTRTLTSVSTTTRATERWNTHGCRTRRCQPQRWTCRRARRNSSSITPPRPRNEAIERAKGGEVIDLCRRRIGAHSLTWVRRLHGWQMQ